MRPPVSSGTGPIFTTDWYDGFGRSRAKSGTAPLSPGATAASNAWIRYTTYNPRGQADKESQPFHTDSATLAEARWTRHSYDALNRRIRSEHPDLAAITMSYQTGGGVAFNRVKVTDESGHDTVHGRVVRVTRYLGGAGTNAGKEGFGTANSTHLEWDPLDRIVAVEDEPGNRWTAVYDTLSRRTSVSDPDHGLWTFTYDKTGLVTRQVDANNARTDFAYDGRRRMLMRRHYAGGSLETSKHLYTYDGTRAVSGTTYYNGDQLSKTEAFLNGSIVPWLTQRHDHDANDNRVRDEWAVTHASLNATYWTRQIRDAAGFVTGRQYSDGDIVGGGTTPWLYDKAGRLVSIPGHVTSFDYNARGVSVCPGLRPR